MAFLEISNLHARVAAPGGRDILRGVNLSINAGEVHAIMGKNGSGKSTLVQVLAGRDFRNLYEPDVGWSLLRQRPDGADVCSSCHAPTTRGTTASDVASLPVLTSITF